MSDAEKIAREIADELTPILNGQRRIAETLGAAMTVEADKLATFIQPAIATAILAAEARGYAAAREEALRAISTLPGYSSELERAHEAIRKMEPKP